MEKRFLWLKIPTNDMKGARGHCLVTIDGNVFAFGGISRENEFTNSFSYCVASDEHGGSFMGERLSWKPVTEDRGNRPEPRAGHTCTKVGKKMLVYGGWNGSRCFPEIHFYDTVSQTWTSPAVEGRAPEARFGHTAAAIGSKVFVFGGYPDGKYGCNDMYVLDTEKLKWEITLTHGPRPEFRSFHTCSVHKTSLTVLGGSIIRGQDEKEPRDHVYNDVHIFNSETSCWTKLNAAGELLPPLAGHLAFCHDMELFVFGGKDANDQFSSALYVLNLDSLKWSKITAFGFLPYARANAAGDVLSLKLRLEHREAICIISGGTQEFIRACPDSHYLMSISEPFVPLTKLNSDQRGLKEAARGTKRDGDEQNAA